jgi:hypothetical protein
LAEIGRYWFAAGTIWAQVKQTYRAEVFDASGGEPRENQPPYGAVRKLRCPSWMVTIFVMAWPVLARYFDASAGQPAP